MGSIEVAVGGSLVPLGGAKPRTLLAALLLEHGRVVPIHRLIDIIWPDVPPHAAKAAIQTYVKTLRQSLARHTATEVLVTRAPGYLAQIPDGSLDVDNFTRLVTTARQASTPREISDLLSAALALWRGPALAGLGDSLLAGEATRLEQLRLTATQERINAELTLGRHGQLVAELAALVDRHPTNERFRGQYMTALYRLGRQSDALAAFREGRDALVEELGVEPGAELTALHQAILRGDASTLAPSAAEAVRVTVPTQLPLAPADFTGRAAEVDALVAALTPEPVKRAQVIAGRGGSGKSALAVHVAHRVADHFPDGQLYAELRGMSDAPADAGEVLGRFLRALGAASIPATTDDRADLYRSLLADRRMLVLLDDAASEQQVRPLLPGGPRCAVVVTARNRLGGLTGVHRTDLDVMADGEALELLARIAGGDRVAAEESAARVIVERCGRLPLAISIAGARLATRRGWPLKLLADRLTDERRRLDELAIADLEVRANFELSYRTLAPDCRQALRRLGYLGVSEFAPWIVAWLLEATEAEAEELLERLVDTHLIDFATVDDMGAMRYRLHDLIRIHSRELAEAEEPAEALKAAVARVLGGWLTLVDEVAAESPPEEIQWRRPPVETYPVSAQTTALVVAAPHDWFESEQAALVVGVERAAVLGLHDMVCHFASARLTGPSFLGARRFEARQRMNTAALAAARRAGDRHGEAMMLAELGQLRYMQDRFTEARQQFIAALQAFRELGDAHGQAVALAGLGTVCRESSRLAEGLYFLDQASVLLRQIGDDAGIGYVQRLAGSVRLERGDYGEAWAALEESLAAYRRVGSRRGAGLTLRTISLYHRAGGRLEQAIATATEAVAIFQHLGDRLMEAYAVRALAKARLRLGQPAEMVGPLRSALTVCETMGDRWGQAATLRTLGELHLAEGALEDAEACLNAAMTLWDAMEAPLWRARTERDMAQLHEARGEPDLAAVLRSKAMQVFRDHEAREYAELGANATTSSD